jgi:hypothetical protein
MQAGKKFVAGRPCRIAGPAADPTPNLTGNTPADRLLTLSTHLPNVLPNRQPVCPRSNNSRHPATEFRDSPQQTADDPATSPPIRKLNAPSHQAVEESNETHAIRQFDKPSISTLANPATDVHVLDR